MSVAVNLDRHGAALEDALTGVLEIERSLLDVDPSLDRAKDQREDAARAVAEIEAFLVGHGLPVPEED